MNSVTLNDPNNSGDYIRFTFEKSILEYHCKTTIELQNNNEIYISDKQSVHFNEILKIANWYKNMGNYSDVFPDLIIADLNLKFSNYYFEKGEGVYYLLYNTELGKVFKFHFWEQIGNSNTFIYDQFMQCLESFK
jgi:hypothetical protein